MPSAGWCYLFIFQLTIGSVNSTQSLSSEAASAPHFTALSEGIIKSISTCGPRFVPKQTLEETIVTALSGKTWSYVSSYFILVPACALDLLLHLVQCELLVFSTSNVWSCSWPVLCSHVLAVSLVQCPAWTPWPYLDSVQLFQWFWLWHCDTSTVSQIQAWAQPCYKGGSNLVEH